LRNSAETIRGVVRSLGFCGGRVHPGGAEGTEGEGVCARRSCSNSLLFVAGGGGWGAGLFSGSGIVGNFREWGGVAARRGEGFRPLKRTLRGGIPLAEASPTWVVGCGVFGWERAGVYPYGRWCARVMILKGETRRACWKRRFLRR
jgi:hypothetical protein